MVPEIPWYEDGSQHEVKSIRADHLIERFVAQVGREMHDLMPRTDRDRVMVAINSTLHYLTVRELKFFYGTMTAIGIMTDKRTSEVIGDFWIEIRKIEGGTRTICRTRTRR